uniref:Glycosyltransferase 61 catalytic domain-containing protein n=1 Tax=Tetradesmus obliquus TaxID=3088 RepID=A0A383VIN0_TETOB|eukprot:jgi/Sobl393_1/15216/SZX65375.1
MQIHGVSEQKPAKPLILINDKRYGVNGQEDRRMLLDIEPLIGNLSELYPAAEVKAVRFRDMEIPEQIRWIARAKVFITTQGSSAFLLVFLPAGATCIVVGSPSGNSTTWTSFYELDRWFPLTYVQFQRYEVDVNSIAEYEVKTVPGHWQPDNPAEARDWWLYNANVRLRLERLKVLLEPALQAK